MCRIGGRDSVCACCGTGQSAQVVALMLHSVDASAQMVEPRSLRKLAGVIAEASVERGAGVERGVGAGDKANAVNLARVCPGVGDEREAKLEPDEIGIGTGLSS